MNLIIFLLAFAFVIDIQKNIFEMNNFLIQKKVSLKNSWHFCNENIALLKKILPCLLKS